MDDVGPYAWEIIHHAAASLPCEHCAQHGVNLTGFIHDVVNIQTDKPLFNSREAFLGVGDEIIEVVESQRSGTSTGVAAEAERIAREVLQSLPLCEPNQSRELDACVAKIGPDPDINIVDHCRLRVGCR